MLALSLVHENVAPVNAGVVVNGMLIASPGQKLWSATAVTTGCGFRVMLKVITEVAQLFFVALTVTTPTIGEFVLFAANVQPGMLSVLPVPEARPKAAKLVTLQLQLVTGSALVAKLIVL